MRCDTILEDAKLAFFVIQLLNVFGADPLDTLEGVFGILACLDDGRVIGREEFVHVRHLLPLDFSDDLFAPLTVERVDITDLAVAVLLAEDLVQLTGAADLQEA